MEAFLIALAAGLAASAIFELLHVPDARRRHSGATRLSGRLLVSDHNRPRHKAALWALTAARWTLVALGAGAGGWLIGGMLADQSAGTVGATTPILATLGIVSGLYMVTITQSRGALVRGVIALLAGTGIAAGILNLLGGVPSAGEAVIAILVFGLSIAFCWRALGLIPPLRH